MRGKLNKIFLCFVFLLPILAGAEKQPQNSLQLLIESCLKSNPELRAAYHRYKAKKAAVIHKTALADPMVNFRHNFEPVQTRTGEQKQVFTISQKLPWPGKQSAAIKLETQRSAIDKIKYDIKLRNLITSIKATYAEIWFLNRAIATTRKQNQLLDKLADRINAGQTDPTLMPVLKAQSQMAQAANDLINYSEMLKTQMALLKSLSGLEKINPEWFTQLPDVVIPGDKNELLNKALEQKLEVQKAALKNKIARTRIKVAHFANKPDFTIGYSRAFTGDRPDLTGAGPAKEGKDPVGVFVQMNLPIWQNKNRSRVSESKEQELESRKSVESVKDKTRANFTRLWFQLKNKNRIEQIYQQTVLPQAKIAFESAGSIYLNSKNGFSDYLETANTYYAISIAAWRAQADLYISATEVESFTGIPFQIKKQEH
jgi:outer membrane protein TolC